jgi:hypothetical protein
MDPFLEINPRWECFHGWFVRKLAEQSLPKAQSLDCWIDVERTIYQRLPSGEVLLVGRPDDLAGTSFDETMERVRQDYLVVRELGRFQRVLSVVEVLSPANKGGSYMARYREKRRRYIESRAHFMEIDLLREGENPARGLFPELPASAYFVFIARKTDFGRNEEGYPIELRDPLPTIGLPLGPPRPDLPLDLAAAFRSAYDLSVRPGSIEYHQETPPPPPMNEVDSCWLSDVVQRESIPD